MSHRRLHRWRFGVTAALSLVALALLYASGLLLALTVVPLTYVAYGALSGLPADPTVRIERSFGDRAPYPGERVTVTLTVENAGTSTLPDLRVIDGVPDALAVVDGTPRLSAALRPGDEATTTYTVVARRGDHAFEDPVVRLRSLSGSQDLTRVVPAAGAGTLSALTPLSDPPLRNTTLLRAGTHPTDSGGEGIEFRSTREYQPGDPLNRIHWRGFAKTGELSTVSFREERAVRTVVVVDARAVGRTTPRPGHPTGTELCGYAGQRLHEALTAADVVTSVGAVGVDADGPVPRVPGGVAWVDGRSDDAARLARRLFETIQTGDDRDGDSADATEAMDSTDATDPGGAADPDDASATPRADGGDSPDALDATVASLLAQFPPTAQVVFVTPLVDEWPVDLARRIHERGYPLTVVSPDVTGEDSLGQSIVGIERAARLRRVEAVGATTIGWDLADPIDVALSASLTHLLSE